MRAAAAVLSVAAFLICVHPLGAAERESAISPATAEVVDSIEVNILFPVGKSEVDPSFGDNSARLRNFLERIDKASEDPERHVGSVRVEGYASPDGGHDFNVRLARRRAENIADYLRTRTGLADSLFAVHNSGIDWAGLYAEVEKSDMRDKERVLDIIKNEPELTTDAKGRLVKSRKQVLMNLNGGRTWNWMLTNLYPNLRSSASVVCYFQTLPSRRLTIEENDTLPPPYLEMDEAVEENVAETAERRVKEERDFFMSVYTNMLMDAAALPNLGAEFYLGKNFSAAANWTYGWWSKKSKNRFWRGYGGYLSGRYWFGSQAERKPLTGHHAGVYAAMLIYDFEWGGTGYLGGTPRHNIFDHPSYSFGVEYGFSLPIGPRLNIDFTLGVGTLGGRYYQYGPMDGHYVWKSTHERHWWGPTRLEVNLVWLLGHGNVNKKGGAK